MPRSASETRPDNQRLEFLGDRVLGLVDGRGIVRGGPWRAPRARWRHALTHWCAKRPAPMSRARSIWARCCSSGRSEMVSGGRRKEALLADAMEAVIAAVYLDAGLGRCARDDTAALWGARIAAVEDDARDAKTALQEWAQARGQVPPVYAEDLARRAGSCTGLHHRGAVGERRGRTGRALRPSGRRNRRRPRRCCNEWKAGHDRHTRRVRGPDRRAECRQVDAC